MNPENRVRIVEVGPRDGLQNESTPVSTEGKLRYLRGLVNAGLREIEVTSFVHPRVVPQLADAAEIMAELPKDGAVTFWALVPNQRGLDRAMEAGVRRVAVFTAASESFTKANIRMSIEESLVEFERVGLAARSGGVTVRGYVSTAFSCPYEGPVPKTRVRSVVERLMSIGVDEVAISDTIGTAVPRNIMETVGFVLETVPAGSLALHLHDTCGTALANVCAGLQLGLRTFDSAAGGIGGCPFAPGAAGNLATEDLVYLLEQSGMETGVRLEGVLESADIIAGLLNRALDSRQWRRLRGRRSSPPNGSARSESASSGSAP